MTDIVLAAVIGYLLGSIPFGVVLTRLAGLGDIRRIGSGSIGATNVLRTGNKGLAALTLALDLAKGVAAVWIGSLWGGDAMLAAAGAVILGHMFPVWLGFRGGKGVATFVGCMIGLYWPAALAFAIVWLGAAFVSRYSSVAGMLGVIASVIVLALLGSIELAVLGLIMVLLILWKHRENIARLRAGTETKIGRKAAPSGFSSD
jgi:glycerol-3-phosphate acyltransferase PlsY